MNGAVLTYIKENLQSTATKFFLSSFTNRYINNPVYEDHYSTFSDVLNDFWINLPKLVNSLLNNYEEQLKIEAAFLADDSTDQIQLHLKTVLESWIDTYFLKLNKAGLQMEMEAACDKEFENMLSTLNETEQTPQEIIQTMLKRIVKQMVVVFKQKWENQMKDPTAKASFEDSYRKMIVELTNQLTGEAPDILASLNITVPVQPPEQPEIPTTPLAQAAVARTEMPKEPVMPKEPEMPKELEIPRLPEMPKEPVMPVLPAVPTHVPASFVPPKQIPVAEEAKAEAEKEEEDDDNDNDDECYIMVEPEPRRQTIKSLTPSRNQSPIPSPSPSPSVSAVPKNQPSAMAPPSVSAAPSSLQVSMIQPPTTTTTSYSLGSGMTYTISKPARITPANAPPTLQKPLFRPAPLARPSSNRRVSSS